MKKLSVLILSVIVLSLILTSCSSGNRIAGGGSSKKCGCGLNKGFVGY